MRKTRFSAGEFYHIYNRGVDKRIVCRTADDFQRFFKSMQEFNSIEPIESIYANSFEKKKQKTKRLIDIICYCLNANHYHFILQQLVEGGISEFMKRLGGGYTKFFNHKYKRNGPLFGGKFKSVHITSNEQLLYTSAYVNLNNRAHKLSTKSFLSSWNEYIENENGVCNKEIILGQFKNEREYSKFAIETLENILQNKESRKEPETQLLE